MAAAWILALAAALPQEAGPAEADYRAGLSLKAEGKLDEAIARLRRAVGMPEPSGLDRDALSRFVETRAESQWELAECLYAKGACAEAIEAYRTSREKYPRNSLAVSPCGKVGAVGRFEASLGEARCLERMGRYDEAVRLYFRMIYGDDSLALSWDPAPCFRLADLYGSAGQESDLLAILAGKDEAYVNRRMEEGKGWVSRSDASREAPGRLARRVLDLRAWGREGRWTELADFAAAGPAKLDGFGPGYWEAGEACRILALRPEAAVPLLKRKLHEDRPWVCFALGLCGTREAVEAVVGWARGAKDPARVASLIRALDQASPAGKSAAEELERGAPEGVRRRLQEKAAPRPALPPLPEGTRLPARI